MSFIFILGAVCGCPPIFFFSSFFLFQWTKSSRSQNSFVSNGIVVLVSFYSQYIGTHTTTRACTVRICHRMCLLLFYYAPWQVEKYLCWSCCCWPPPPIFSISGILHGFPLKFYSPHKWYPINAFDDDDDGDRNSSFYANKGHHIKN